MSSVLVFSYGSNMSTPRLQARVSTAQPLQIGQVRNRRLVFHKRGADGSGKADAWKTNDPEDCVWGVVFRLSLAQKPILDECEFLGVGYDEQQVQVVGRGTVLTAWMYVARPEAIEPGLQPFSWYHDFVVHGARQHGLPDRYIQQLQEFSTSADPDLHRHRTHQRLLHQAGSTSAGDDPAVFSARAKSSN